MSKEEVKKRKRGPAPSEGPKRTQRLNVFFTEAEYSDLLTRVRSKWNLAEYVRAQTIRGEVEVSISVPEINIKAYAELARTAANINQISRKLNSADFIDLGQLQAELEAFRRALLKGEAS